MACLISADHLFCGVHGVAATGAALALGRLQPGLKVGRGGDIGAATDRHQRGRMTVTEALRAEVLAVAGLAIDLVVGAVASKHRVQRSVAFTAVEAQLMPLLFPRILITFSFIFIPLLAAQQSKNQSL